MGVDVDVILFDNRVYRARVLPSYQRFIDSGDRQPLLDVVTRLARSLPSDPARATFASRESFEDFAAIISGKIYYSSTGLVDDGTRRTTPEDLSVLVKGQVGPALFEALCLVRDGRAEPKQSMSRTGLPLYLYTKSRWIEDYFTFAKEVTGDLPAIVVGEWCRCFAPNEVKRFDEELQSVPPPHKAEAPIDHFVNLRKIVRMASIEPGFRLMLAIS